MEIVKTMLSVFFLGVMPLGVILALLIAGVMALVGKKIKRGVWIGLCAFGVLQMIGTELLYPAWAGGIDFSTVGYLLGRWLGCLCAAGFIMLAPTGKKKPALAALLVPVVLYVGIAELIGVVNMIKQDVGFGVEFLDILKGFHNYVWWPNVFFGLPVLMMAAWYLAGRKKALRIVFTLLSVVALIWGVGKCVRMMCLVFGPTLEDVLKGDYLYMFYGFGWMPSILILLTQMIQLGLVAGKMRQEEPVKPVKAPVVATPNPAAEPVAAKPASAPKFCAGCGHLLPEGSSFCNNCGMKI